MFTKGMCNAIFYLGGMQSYNGSLVVSYLGVFVFQCIWKTAQGIGDVMLMEKEEKIVQIWKQAL